MTDNKNVSDISDQSVQLKDGEGSRPHIEYSERRRRILKGAAVAAPLMMTVASRPVLGAQCTPSAWVSGNLSDNGQDRSCGGRSPGYWKTNPHRWQGTRFMPGTCGGEVSEHHMRLRKHSWGKESGYDKTYSWQGTGTCKTYGSDGTPFHKFSQLGRRGVFPGRYYRDRTLMQVLWLKGHEDPYQLGAHIVAALLNAASIPDYGMSVREVIHMYGQLARLGYFQPSAGDPMSPQEVVLFIQNTFS